MLSDRKTLVVEVSATRKLIWDVRYFSAGGAENVGLI